MLIDILSGDHGAIDGLQNEVNLRTLKEPCVIRIVCVTTVAVCRGGGVA